ncbi:MAG: DUF4270 family protein, partial [Massilibacteroides sp.]|nr:DUF4270 family protein [Massilibacteroides sp.]
MQKNSFFFCLLALGIVLTSCYDETNTYGKQLVESAFRNASIDSCTVLVTAVRMDSVETSGTSTALIGRYTHANWGTVSAFTYIPYERPTYSTDIDVYVVMDSLVLRLAYNGYFMGDTNICQNFTVHRLTEKIVLNDNGYLYNTSSVQYSPEILGHCSFKPRPKSGERVKIRLSDELGKDLLTRFHSRDESVSSDLFENYFKGLAIVPDEGTSTNVQGFAVSDSLSALYLHYHIFGDGDNEQILMFSPNTSTQFNHYEHDRKGSLLEDYPSGKTGISSVNLENNGLVFGGLGWYSRLEFPYLNNLMMQGEQIDIETAVLKIYPKLKTYSSFNNLPDSIYLYIADENNVVVDAVTDYLGTEVQQGTLVKDDTFPENTYYYFDLTTFIREELGAFGIYKHNLQLVFNNDYYTKT